LNDKRVSALCDELASLINQAYLSQNEFESVYLQLSKSERRLYSVVNEFEEVKSSEIRFLASVGNISQVADRINKKLEAYDDPRRLVADRRIVTNDYGCSSSENFWTIQSAGNG
jgi:hypothetical protein